MQLEKQTHSLTNGGSFRMMQALRALQARNADNSPLYTFDAQTVIWIALNMRQLQPIVDALETAKGTIPREFKHEDVKYQSELAERVAVSHHEADLSERYSQLRDMQVSVDLYGPFDVAGLKLDTNTVPPEVVADLLPTLNVG